MDPESGLDAVRSVGIRDGRIEAISEHTLEGDRVIDATGLVVAPGFIDLNAHPHGGVGKPTELFELLVRDGVTSSLQLEVGAVDVAGWYEQFEGGQVLNYGVSVGHLKVRMAVMGDSGSYLASGPAKSQQATAEQIAEMKRLIVQGLEHGALAMGFGLAYTPAATTFEFESMLQIAADYGAPVYIHVRGVNEAGVRGVNEAIGSAANKGVSLHVAHANSTGGARTTEFLEAIEQARSGGQDVTTDAYPYSASMTTINAAILDDWESWKADSFPVFQWAETGERLTRETFARYRAQGGFVIHHKRTEKMTRTAIANPLTMISSDAAIGHPRAAGTRARVLGKYVREEGLLTLMDALRRMTVEPARRLEAYVPAMELKGRLRVGADADITIFDATTVIDRATYTDPTLPSEGILFVLVNGVLVVDGGELVPNARPGRGVRAR
jgi:N-acyl-D-aspartate/D-glutamate deacylase